MFDVLIHRQLHATGHIKLHQKKKCWDVYTYIYVHIATSPIKE